MVKEDDVSSSGLFLRPDGHLGGTGFDADDGAGLLALLTGRAPSGDDAARSYFRRLAADHVRRLVVAAEDGRMPTDETLARVRPDALARLTLLAALPPMTGGEYWTDGTLCALYDRLETAIRAATEAAGGDFLAFVRSLGAGWRDVGKVTLHLAENKGDRSGTRPFAFLATFVHQSDADGQARHLPLSAALKAFAARPAALKRILAPLEEAGRTDSFLAGLLESRRIFQPCALTIAEAYRFLKGITGYETAGLLVRTGRLWAKQPTRAQVTVSVGKTPGGGLTAQSLCSFDATVTVNGASLSPEELETLMNARDGLVRSGAVIDLQIAAGRVAALVIGSGRNPYDVVITIAPMAKSKPKTARPRSGVPGKTIAVEASDAAGDSDGGLMRTVRLRLGLSQAEMGQRFGTYQAIISQIERGKARLRPGWAERLREMELHGK